MSRVYKSVEPGELIYPVMKGYRLACCDCGLVHKVDFGVFKGKVLFRVWRDNRATAALRREAAKKGTA